MLDQLPEPKAISLCTIPHFPTHLLYMMAATPLFFCNSMTLGLSFFSPHVNNTRFFSVTFDTRSRFDSREAESKSTPWREDKERRERERKGGTIVCVTVVYVCITTYE